MANELSTGLHGSTRVSMAEEREHQVSLMAKRVMDVPNDLQKRFEWSSGLITYAGYAARSLSSSQTGWLLHKFTYTSSDVTLIQSAYDSWDNRATASYA